MDVGKSKIVIAGCGPGSPDYLTPAVQRAVARADVLVGTKRLLALFPGHGGEKITVTADIAAILQEMAHRQDRQRMVVLVTGDPGLCSLAGPVLRRFGRQACDVIAGVSAVQVAFARIGLDWLDARIIDAHGENPEIDPAMLLNDGKIAVFAGRPAAIRWTAALVQRLGRNRRVYLCENLTLADESVRRIEANDLELTPASTRTIVLLIKEEFFE